jgi:hypothetical protein
MEPEDSGICLRCGGSLKETVGDFFEGGNGSKVDRTYYRCQKCNLATKFFPQYGWVPLIETPEPSRSKKIDEICPKCSWFGRKLGLIEIIGGYFDDNGTERFGTVRRCENQQRKAK